MAAVSDVEVVAAASRIPRGKLKQERELARCACASLPKRRSAPAWTKAC